MRDGVLTLYLDDGEFENSEDQSTDEEVKSEEVYVPECDSDRIAKLLERSQRAVEQCQMTIQNVEQTQEHLREVRQGCQDTFEKSAEFEKITEKLTSQVFTNLVTATQELEKTAKA